MRKRLPFANLKTGMRMRSSVRHVLVLSRVLLSSRYGVPWKRIPTRSTYHSTPLDSRCPGGPKLQRRMANGKAMERLAIGNASGQTNQAKVGAHEPMGAPKPKPVPTKILPTTKSCVSFGFSCKCKGLLTGVPLYSHLKYMLMLAFHRDSSLYWISTVKFKQQRHNWKTCQHRKIKERSFRSFPAEPHTFSVLISYQNYPEFMRLSSIEY